MNGRMVTYIQEDIVRILVHRVKKRTATVFFT